MNPGVQTLIEDRKGEKMEKASNFKKELKEKCEKVNLDKNDEACNPGFESLI